MRTEVEPRRTVHPLERLLRDAHLEQPFAPLLLITPGAERADVERIRRQHSGKRGQVELLVVRQHHDRRRVVGPHPREDFLGPRDDQLVRARNPFRRRESPARVRSDRAPAEPLGRCAQRLGRIDRAEDEQSRRRAEHVREHALPVELHDLRMATAQELVCDRIVALDRKPLRAVLELGEQDCAPVAQQLDPPRELTILLLNENVDLAAARQADLERLLVGDAVREQLRRIAAQHSAARLVDLGLDAAA